MWVKIVFVFRVLFLLKSNKNVVFIPLKMHKAKKNVPFWVLIFRMLPTCSRIDPHVLYKEQIFQLSYELLFITFFRSDSDL